MDHFDEFKNCLLQKILAPALTYLSLAVPRVMAHQNWMTT
jgi:hypothetical protein